MVLLYFNRDCQMKECYYIYTQPLTAYLTTSNSTR